MARLPATSRSPQTWPLALLRVGWPGTQRGAPRRPNTRPPRCEFGSALSRKYPSSYRPPNLVQGMPATHGCHRPDGTNRLMRWRRLRVFSTASSRRATRIRAFVSAHCPNGLTCGGALPRGRGSFLPSLRRDKQLTGGKWEAGLSRAVDHLRDASTRPTPRVAAADSLRARTGLRRRSSQENGGKPECERRLVPEEEIEPTLSLGERDSEDD